MTSHPRDDDDDKDKNNKRKEPPKAVHDAPKRTRGLPSEADLAEAARRYDLEHGGPPSINEPPPDRPGTPPADPQQQLPLEKVDPDAPQSPPQPPPQPPRPKAHD